MSRRRLALRHRRVHGTAGPESAGRDAADALMTVREVVPGGRAEGTLLWIHGLGESGLGFEEIVTSPELSGFVHLVPDLPGYGRSPWPDEPLSLEDHALRLARWMEVDGLDHVTLVGHSMGGVVGTMLAERAPERIRAFLNVEGNVSPGDCVYSRHADGVDLDAWLDGAFDRLVADVHRRGVDDLAHAGYAASLRFCDPRTFHRNGRELVALSRAEGMAVRQAALPLPHRYLLGSPGGTGERSRRLLDEASVPRVTVTPAGHWPFLDRPGDFTAELLRFLADV